MRCLNCMNVRNIIKASAEFLNLNNVVKYLDGNCELSECIQDDINNLLLSVNMVNTNVASSYIEIIGVSNLEVVNNLILFSNISDKSIIEIKKVESLDGKRVSFKILPEGLSVERLGRLKIEFSYFPEKVNIDDDINYYLKLNDLTFAMGVVGEYLYIKGAIDDAYIWDKRFKSSMFNLLRPKRNIRIPARRW